MLRHLGFHTDSIGSASEALNRLKEEEPYTFLLTDIKMPEMDGFELIKRVKTDYPTICIIAMTGYTKEYKYVDVVNAGATDFIIKPFLIEELEAKVKRGIIERNIKRELNTLSITDSLTGLYNQGQFFARLKEEITRAQRQNNQLSLIFIDLDGFKGYNDKYGHLAGDELLKKVGGIINSNIRLGVDSGYRYGGDEFGIILIDVASNIGEKIGRRIERVIEKECNIGASMAYANFSVGMTEETFVKEADKRLYEVKRGKSRQGRRNST
jgi:diguanylate cyclase (GGDEF)-like protein